MYFFIFDTLGQKLESIIQNMFPLVESLAEKGNEHFDFWYAVIIF